MSYAQDGPTDPSVDFTARVSGGTPSYLYGWSFGDGTSSDLEAPTHSYDRGGRYWVQLLVQDAGGNAGYGVAQVLVAGPPEILLLFYYPVPAEARRPTYFTAIALDPDGGRIAQYRWDFGDGSSQVTSEPYAAHTYLVSGN